MPQRTYIASHHTNSTSGINSIDKGYFNQDGDVVSGSLHALRNNGVDGPNGVFSYGNGGFPSNSNGQGHNHWVDVRFAPSLVAQENAQPGTRAWQIQPGNAAVNRGIEGYFLTGIP